MQYPNGTWSSYQIAQGGGWVFTTPGTYHIKGRVYVKYDGLGQSDYYMYSNILTFYVDPIIQPLSVTISGPSTAPCATGTWSANVSGGYPPYTYQWYHMYTSGGGDEGSLQQGSIIIEPDKQINTWYPVGNNTSTLNYYLCGGNSYIRVDVGDSHSTLKSIQKYVAGASGGGGLIKAVANGSATLSKADLEIPKEYNLKQNYPNPFNPSTKISYSLQTEGRVSLKIYNTLGEEVITLADEIKPAGSYEAEFNASNLPSGIYIYRMQSGEYVSTKKMLLIK